MSRLITYKNRKETNRIVLHDSHTLPEVCECEQVDRWAELARDGGRQMGLLDTGYHYIIERNGVVVHCRDKKVIGSHTPGHNMDSIGICLVGGREDLGEFAQGIDNFTTAQKISLFRLIYDLLVDYPNAEVVGHSEIQRYRNKNLPPCPPLDMDIIREDVKLFVERGYLL
jgi:hypothetical protein